MKTLILSTALLLFSFSANAIETGYYNFVFVPDNSASSPFTVCFYVEDQGKTGKPYLELGEAFGDASGPYGMPGGSYNITSPNALAITMSTSGLNATPQYQYFLTAAVENDELPRLLGTRYMIALASQPPPPPRGETRSGSRPGVYTLIDTGSFSAKLISTQSCT